MTRKDIEKAAEEYANEACRPLWRLGSEQVCMADFIAGWDACLKHLGEIPWDEAMREIIDSKGRELNKKQPAIIESKLQVADKVYPMSFEQNRLELHNLEVRTKVSQ